MGVLVTGTLGFDYIMDFPGRFADRIMPEKIHNLSLSFIVDTLTKQFGGTAGNIAYTLKLLEVEPWILAPVGSDFAPYATHLKKHKIPLSYVSVHKDVVTSSYFVMTDKQDNQIGSFYLGATKYAKKLHIRDMKKKPPFVIISPTEPSAMNQSVSECQAEHISYLYDPAFQIGSLSVDDLHTGIGGARMLIGNDYEIALIERKLDISHEELIAMVPVLITTLGSRGSIIETHTEAIHVKPAKPTSTTDPTGAGDAYRAGLVAGLVRGYDLAVCGQMGSVAAVYTVETYGTQTHTFTKKEFMKRYKENYGAGISL